MSKGPQPIKITDYTGKGAAAAKAALTKAGFKVKITTENSDTVNKGMVISQSPDKGTGVKGDTVTLKESLGPVMVTIPNVRSMGVDAAKKVMTEAGFKTKVQAGRGQLHRHRLRRLLQAEREERGPEGLDHHPVRRLTAAARRTWLSAGVSSVRCWPCWR